MKMKRYVIMKDNQTENTVLEKYIAENNISEEEIQKIKIERPSEITVFYSESGETEGNLYLWHNRPDYNGKKTSYIGNVTVNEAFREKGSEILEEIFKQLKNEKVQVIIGPLNGTTWNTYRYVTEKGERPKFLMEPWNEDYYPDLFEKTGFVSLAGYISSISENMKKSENIKRKMEKIKKFDFYNDIKVESIENKDLNEVLNDVYDLTIEAFKNNFLYTELDREIFLKMYMSYKDKLVKQFFKLVYLKEELVGYVFGIPDYAELYYKKKVDTVILKTIAVAPKYNGKGIGYILIDEFIKEVQNNGYSNIIYALMHESNVSKNTGLLLGEKLREYTLFIKEL
ncbi:GNAT family N-acetyltransferase [Pseudoleptotrichia goodfellowii]|uniref:Acetyltransferase, GNAT family n=1 Tax=Pseudoleptotrichia goodfellowii TaxID=157692 RepID=A0A510J7D0_9FUSO|nr:GNAT family N-acetyltransferase [Pseudoleptotrichia goodfellowii]BBM35129.1 acetyltransferase, GNAT family [Pseudoleptotrichia goodfellowii]